MIIAIIAVARTVSVMTVNRRLNRHGLPFFFQYAVGGAIKIQAKPACTMASQRPRTAGPMPKRSSGSRCGGRRG